MTCPTDLKIYKPRECLREDGQLVVTQVEVYLPIRSRPAVKRQDREKTARNLIIGIVMRTVVSTNNRIGTFCRYESVRLNAIIETEFAEARGGAVAQLISSVGQCFSLTLSKAAFGQSHQTRKVAKLQGKFAKLVVEQF
jgi:hypothetical protein